MLKYYSVTIYFDHNGNYESVNADLLKDLPNIVSNRNTITDHAIYCWGTHPSNLLRDKYTCLDLNDLLDSSNPNIDWIVPKSSIREDDRQTEDSTGGTGLGTSTYTYAYKRTIEFGVKPLNDGDHSREYTFTVYSGYYRGTKASGGSNNFVMDDDAVVQITIFQHNKNKESVFPKRACYKLFKDDVNVFGDNKEIEAKSDAVTTLDIFVQPSGTDYSANIISPVIRHYIGDSFNGDRTLLESSGLEINVTGQNANNPWLSYEIDEVPDKPEFDDEYDAKYPYVKWLKFNYKPNTTGLDRFCNVVIKEFEKEIFRLQFRQYAEDTDTNPTVNQSKLDFKASKSILPYTASTEARKLYFTHESITGLKVTSSETWLTVNNINTDNEEGTVDIQWSENPDSSSRIATITLEGTSSIDGSVLSSEINAYQNAYNTGSSKPRDEVSSQGYIAIDDNTGEDYDPTALLFKDNNANVYSTIEAKDNRLFLGNFKNSDFSLDLFSALKSVDLPIPEASIEIPNAAIIDNTSNYEYVPNMKINSQDKRIFKTGETYLLGLVFIKSNGVKSTVFYLGEREPEIKPSISDKGDLTKPIFKVCLQSNVLKTLIDKDVIGVIPVRAVNTNYKVLCQGFLNPTITSWARKSENLTSQYNWFQRLSFKGRAFGESSGDTANTNNNIEFQCTDDNDNPDNIDQNWMFNNEIVTINTPEVECSEILTTAALENCVISPVYKSKDITYINSIQLNFNGKYIHSRFVPPTGGWTSGGRLSTRVMREFVWKGFLDNGSTKETDPAFSNQTSNEAYYQTFAIYPWQRNKAGGEGPSSVIESKKYFTSMYIKTTDETNPAVLGTVNKASIYQEDYPALLKFGNDIYQGNTDYIININKNYKAFTKEGSFSKANPEIGVYAGYDKDGNITDPIYMRYRCAEHIALKMNTPITSYQNNTDINGSIICAELRQSDESFVLDTDPKSLSVLNWVKCGDIKPLPKTYIQNDKVDVEFTEGDYFYGRFDSLRTYPYANDDVNSVTDIVSGMLCSRVNLDARCDRNRGIGTAMVTPENFNIFNEVYNQDNNYFIYKYFDLNEVLYSRKYDNSIQWSMNKVYGNEIDDWCNIQDVNTLDLDGNKGSLIAIKRFANNMFAFQESGISQILYNESVQISSTNGVPIEIANSGAVSGKRYIHEGIGCQNYMAITTTPLGIYFVDDANTKTFYKMGANGDLEDICLTGGMKSWSLKKPNGFTCWYDPYTQEVVFVNNDTSILYSDTFRRFQCFSDYNSIKHVVNLKGRTYMFKKTVNDNFTYHTIWQKNAIESSTFFSIPKNISMELIVNPEPTMDKTFSTIEYRADAFDSDGTYLDKSTFTSIQVSNEYQDTEEVSIGLGVTQALRKRFRIWSLDIPRDAKYKINGNRDRIRNPWCKITLNMKDKSVSKFMVHDISVTYF